MGVPKPDITCSTDANNLNDILPAVYATYPGARDLLVNLNKTTGKTCACLYDRCNSATVSELFALLTPDTPTIPPGTPTAPPGTPPAELGTSIAPSGIPTKVNG